MISLVGRVRALSSATKWSIIALLCIVATVIVATLKPIPQPLSYHDFADARRLLAIPNALNVLSNVPFVAVGFLGLVFILHRGSRLETRQRYAYGILFAGLLLTGIGSGYYHLSPDIVHSPEYTVTESGTCAEINVQREPPAARLHLKLTDEETGKFIEEPEAQFRRTDGHHAWNASTHREQDILIPPLKPVEVRVGAKGYRTTAPFTIQPMQPGEVRDFTAVLAPTGLGCLHGRVMDADGQAVVGIKVQPLLINDNVNSKALFVDTISDGEFEATDLPTGRYQVTVHSKEMGYDSFSIVKKDGRFPEIDVPASTACADITVNLTAPNGKLVVEVVDAQTHTPLERFKYTVKSAVNKPYWYSEGREWTREVQIPPGQACNLTAESEGYARSDVTRLDPFKSGEVRKISITLQPLHEDGK